MVQRVLPSMRPHQDCLPGPLCCDSVWAAIRPPRRSSKWLCFEEDTLQFVWSQGTHENMEDLLVTWVTSCLSDVFAVFVGQYSNPMDCWGHGMFLRHPYHYVYVSKSIKQTYINIYLAAFQVRVR